MINIPWQKQKQNCEGTHSKTQLGWQSSGPWRSLRSSPLYGNTSNHAMSLGVGDISALDRCRSRGIEVLLLACVTACRPGHEKAYSDPTSTSRRCFKWPEGLSIGRPSQDSASSVLGWWQAGCTESWGSAPALSTWSWKYRRIWNAPRSHLFGLYLEVCCFSPDELCHRYHQCSRS